MDNRTKNTDKPFNAQAVAELRDRLIWFVATQKMKSHRYHWIGNCAPVMHHS